MMLDPVFFTPEHDEWIWKTLRAYRPMSRAALKCTARETATLTSRILTSVSSNLLKKSPKLSNLRECISPTLRRDTEVRNTSLLQSAETNGCG